jgi:diphosphomevalonate decarboxylase
MKPSLAATAVAHSNIALIKYWGKMQKPGNYTAVPSLSLTLDALYTRTHVKFDSELATDEFELDGLRVSGPSRQRVVSMLDAVRERAQLRTYARVTSVNNFPTASGLASSASGFAALAVAASRAAQLDLTSSSLSALARHSSASAARSVHGGLVTLNAGAEYAEPFDTGHDWDLTLLVAITERGRKSVGSTEGMNRCSATSPVYPAWLEAAPRLFNLACEAIRNRDIHQLGQCMEQSTWLMHSTMLTAMPAIVYLAPATVSIINEIGALRSTSVPAYFTTDAGPHVKVLTLTDCATLVRDRLVRIAGVNGVMVCKPGPAAHLDCSDVTKAAP